MLENMPGIEEILNTMMKFKTPVMLHFHGGGSIGGIIKQTEFSDTVKQVSINGKWIELARCRNLQM